MTRATHAGRVATTPRKRLMTLVANAAAAPMPTSPKIAIAASSPVPQPSGVTGRRTIRVCSEAAAKNTSAPTSMFRLAMIV